MIKERKQGLSKPNLIYVGKIIHYEETQNRKISDSGGENITITVLENLRPNKTNSNKTNIDNNFNFKNFDNRFRDTTGQYENLDRFLANANDFINDENIY